MARGRVKGQIVERKEKNVGYIVINENLRIRVETDCLTVEEKTGVDKDTKEVIYGNNKYFTSWDGIFSWLIRRFTTEKIGKKALWTFTEARNEIKSAIKETKDILLGEINKEMKTANKEIKDAMIKFNK